jgi:hypothetical protein
MVTSSNDFRSFVEVFKEAKYRIPFSKYTLCLVDAFKKDLKAFTHLTGPHITELIVDNIVGDTNVYWETSWRRRRVSGEALLLYRKKLVTNFFTKLTNYLHHTPNLEYLEILDLGCDTLNQVIRKRYRLNSKCILYVCIHLYSNYTSATP